MKLVHSEDVEALPVEDEGYRKTSIRWLISEDDGAGNFAMRVISVEPAGCTAYHTHDWEHEVYVLDGKGVVSSRSGEKAIGKHDAVFILSNEPHSFVNKGQETLRFICVIPIKKA